MSIIGDPRIHSQYSRATSKHLDVAHGNAIAARMRNGRAAIEPGYDGGYGTISIFGKGKREIFAVRKRLPSDVV
ncbi:MAG: hypothetical protein WD850_00475 [Candidatus Spechtbacterales bacterium]